MSVRKLLDSLSNLQRALDNLERAVAIPRDRELVAEGTIHRFEITIELFWKTLKRALNYEGFRVETSRDSLKRHFVLAGYMMSRFGLICWTAEIQHPTSTCQKSLPKTIMMTFGKSRPL